MSRIWIGIALCAFLLTAPLHADNWRSDVRAGDKAYEHQKYDEALVRYLEALSSKGDSALIRYDLGNVFHAQEKYDEAVKSFQSALSGADSLTRADALYNTGNALFGMQKYQEAAAAYKSALRLRPGQEDYLHNLQLALHLMKKQQQQQQNQSDRKERKDQRDQQKQDQTQDQQKQQQNQQQQNQQQEQQQEKEPEQQNQPQMAQKDQMTREDAERLLNALQKDEKRIQENLHRQKAAEAGVKKDW
jgi:tetratricopeptide (TPR) repeat protein